VDPYCFVCKTPQLQIIEAHLDSYRQ